MGWVVNSTPRPLYPRERPRSQCTGGWVGLRVGLDGCGKSGPQRGFDLAHSESLHQLSYPGTDKKQLHINYIYPISNTRKWKITHGFEYRQ